jgi:hypothetical protein
VHDIVRTYKIDLSSLDGLQTGVTIRPDRPCFGKLGAPVILNTNHYLVKSNLDSATLYDVSVFNEETGAAGNI